MSNSKTYEALQEINIGQMQNLYDYIAFCKYAYKSDRNRKLNDFKSQIKSQSKTFQIDNSTLSQIHQISGIITDQNNLKNLVLKLPQHSFALWIKFKLLAPYFSKDDDEFYIIQNPILKEKVFKVPMVRGSSWKGALAGVFKKLLNEKNNLDERRKIIESHLRIFGAGSENIKTIEEYLKEKSKNQKEFKDKILEFMLFELGMKITKDDIDKIKNENNEHKLIGILNSIISQKIQKSLSNLPVEFQTHKGRAIFYPTYFEKLSLEIINPHDRRKRAGTVPINYEVVPKDTEGILQIVYIPFDGILKSDGELKSEAEQDLNILGKAIEKLADEGIGAKTKLGWGRFEINEKIYCINSEENIDIMEWKKCHS